MEGKGTHKILLKLSSSGSLLPALQVRVALLRLVSLLGKDSDG